MRTAEQKFWSKVDKSGECWIWKGSIQRYGNFSTPTGKIRAHRFAFELAYGQIPPIIDKNGTGLVVCHTCDNPLCVRIDHLWLGTQAENIADRHAKERDAHNAGRPGPDRERRAKTHCKRGHEFTSENTIYNKRRWGRTCRTCRNQRRSEGGLNV